MKLLCIDAEKRKGSEHFENWIEEGKRYTLRKIGGSLTGETGYLLKEVKNPKIYIPELIGYTEPSFSAKRFVTLQDDSELEEVKEKEKEIVHELV